jgi:hypothetical protein
MYRGVLNEDISTLAIGQMLAIATDGVSFSATEGSFEVTGFEGTKAGDIVYVRVPVTSYAGIVLSVNDVKPDANGNVDIATGG